MANAFRKCTVSVLTAALVAGMALPGVVFADDNVTTYHSDTHTLVLAGDVDDRTISQALSGVNDKVT